MPDALMRSKRGNQSTNKDQIASKRRRRTFEREQAKRKRFASMVREILRKMHKTNNHNR